MGTQLSSDRLSSVSIASFNVSLIPLYFNTSARLGRSGNCSPLSNPQSGFRELVLASESGADGGERAPAVEAAGGDNRTEIGIDLRAPVRSEAIRNFSPF